MTLEGVVLLALFVIAFALVSKRISSLPVSGPMVFVAFGLLVGPEGLDLVDVLVDSQGVLVLAELTLAVLLFSDALRLDVPSLRHNSGLPLRLLGIGLPLTVALGTALTALLLTDLSVAEAALVAAVLAPTDAALGQAVVTDQNVPARIRQSLNVESGLNDGMVVPVVAVFTAMVESGVGGAGSVTDWVSDAASQIGIGVGVGVGFAFVAGAAMAWAHDRGWSRGELEQLATLSIGVGAYALSTLWNGNGFIAAFAAGLTVSATQMDLAAHWSEFSEDLAQLLALVTFTVFGATLVGPALGELTLPIAACAVATLTVGRMVPVWIATIGAGIRPRTRLFMGWFGPRGLASILFGLILVEESELENTPTLFRVITWVVIVSIVAHGMTAAWGARSYGEWHRTHPERDDMGESEPVSEIRAKWTRRAP